MRETLVDCLTPSNSKWRVGGVVETDVREHTSATVTRATRARREKRPWQGAERGAGDASEISRGARTVEVDRPHRKGRVEHGHDRPTRG